LRLQQLLPLLNPRLVCGAQLRVCRPQPCCCCTAHLHLLLPLLPGALKHLACAGCGGLSLVQLLGIKGG
jgi:hypothetical protein